MRQPRGGQFSIQSLSLQNSCAVIGWVDTVFGLGDFAIACHAFQFGQIFEQVGGSCNFMIDSNIGYDY